MDYADVPLNLVSRVWPGLRFFGLIWGLGALIQELYQTDLI